MTRPPDADPATRRRVILTLIVLAQTVANIGPLGIPAIASLIRSDLGLTLTQAGSFLSAYYLGPVAMSLFAGMLADRWGTAKTLVLGQALIAAGLAGASAARSYAVFVTLMVVAGVGYGTLNPASTTAAMSWFPQRRRATVVGLKQVGLPFGGMLGAAILPVLALRLGWRRAVVVGALLIVVCAVACALIYHDPPGHALARRAPGERGPVLAVLLTKDLWLVALATLVFAATQTVWMAFLALYLQGVVGLGLLARSHVPVLGVVEGRHRGETAVRARLAALHRLDRNIDLARTVPMSEHEPAMDLGLVRVLRGKEIVELLFRFDHPGMLILELFRAVVEIFLDRHQ